MFFMQVNRELILKGYGDTSFQLYVNGDQSQFECTFRLNGDVVAWNGFKRDATMVFTMEVKCIVTLIVAQEVFQMKTHIQWLNVEPSTAKPVVSWRITTRQWHK